VMDSRNKNSLYQTETLEKCFSFSAEFKTFFTHFIPRTFWVKKHYHFQPVPPDTMSNNSNFNQTPFHKLNRIQIFADNNIIS